MANGRYVVDDAPRSPRNGSTSEGGACFPFPGGGSENTAVRRTRIVQGTLRGWPRVCRRRRRVSNRPPLRGADRARSVKVRARGRRWARGGRPRPHNSKQQLQARSGENSTRMPTQRKKNPGREMCRTSSVCLFPVPPPGIVWDHSLKIKHVGGEGGEHVVIVYRYIIAFLAAFSLFYCILLFLQFTEARVRVYECLQRKGRWN